MTGKIIKGIAGFYYVYVEETKEAKETATGGILYECKAKGTFRKQKIKPLVGDIVDIAVSSVYCHGKTNLSGRLCPI